jgi:enamine deaminase RidA (YjgF/YER057c/UK114 family)
VALYVPAKRVGELVYCSGQLPTADGRLIQPGQVGAEVTVTRARRCAEVCALNCLAALKGVVGDLDRVVEIVRVCGFVNSAPGFSLQPEVVNGASELLVDLFGEGGRHARVAVGVSALPLNAPVEVELTARVTG